MALPAQKQAEEIRMGVERRPLNTEHPSRIIKCSNIHRMWRDNATF